MGLYSTVDLDLVKEGVEESQRSVLRLLDNEERAKEYLNEVALTDNQDVRLEEAARLHSECNALIDLAKDLAESIGNVRKRMVGIVALIEEGAFKEVADLDGEEWEGKKWRMKIKSNPPTVVVEELKDVPKKYRLEPKPLPNWEDWAVDKNMVKQALVKEKVKSIDGIKLKTKKRIEIKSR